VQTLGFQQQPQRAHRYEVVKRLGVERDAEIILALAHGPFGFTRNVVLKRLFGMGDAQRLAHEAFGYARVTHPAVVRMYDFVVDDGRPTIVLERVHGHSVARMLSGLRARSRDLDETCAIYIGYRVFQALAAAAEAGVVHRNVCPTSVLVPWDGFAKLADFAIAHIVGAPTNARTGIITGNMGYLAPEQLRVETVTERTDVYLGSLLVRELLLRAPIFPRAGRTEKELLDVMAQPNLVPLAAHRPDLPVHVTDALDRGLSPDARDRTLSAAELADILRSVLDVDRAREHLAAVLGYLRPEEDSFTGPRPRTSSTLIFDADRGIS
jgi:serine/threonine-protein kinase